MQQAVLFLFPNAVVRYKFYNRGNTEFSDEVIENLKKEVEKMRYLELTVVEEDYLTTVPYFRADYLEYLFNYQFDPDEVKIEKSDDGLSIIVEGLWRSTILWEVPLMAMLSELHNGNKLSMGANLGRMLKKVGYIDKCGIPWSDFGTRRRYSSLSQYSMLATIKASGSDIKNFIGTSNLHYAQSLDLKPIGTMAHEWIMFHGAKYRPDSANIRALHNWKKMYGDQLSIALPDTYTTGVFLLDFDKKEADQWDGVRQDSGDPTVIADKFIKHYEDIGVDPMTKKIVFSNSIKNTNIINKIAKHCKNKINGSVGIGTWLTNDFPGVTPLNMVIKLDAVQIDDKWEPVVKFSDSSGKITGNPKAVEYYKRVLNIC